MEFTVLRKTKTELEIQITGEDETILHPITHVLLQYPDVEYAAITAENPLAPIKNLIIRVKKGSPEDYLKKAVKQLHDEITAFGKSIQ
jgi:DNA-directed RNA polymerase subunit L